MGLFEDLGRKVGQFTHEAKQAADEGANYACRECGNRFYTEHEACPECGSEDVVELEASAEPTAEAETDDGDSVDASDDPSASE